MFFDFSSVPMPPLKFVLRQEYSPPEGSTRPSPAGTTTKTPWHSEVAIDLAGIDTTAVLYLLERGEETRVLAACIDQTFEPFFQLLTGADFGDGIARLTKAHWPVIYSMLEKSTRSDNRGRILANVIVQGRVQWIVADQFSPAELEQVTGDQVIDLIGNAVQTYLRATDVAGQLPGVIQVLGGPDLMSRRLKAVSSLLGATAGMGTALLTGLRPQDVAGFLSGAQEAISTLRGLRA